MGHIFYKACQSSPMKFVSLVVSEVSQDWYVASLEDIVQPEDVVTITIQ